MASVLDYSTTANSNTTVGGVSIAEGMTPGGVNNGMRAMMADSRKWQLDWSGVTTAGAGNAYTLTSNQGISAYADGQRFSFRADRANTGAATLNIDSRGAKAIRRMDGSAAVALTSGDLVANGVYDVVYIAADDIFVVVNSFGNLPGLTATVTELNYVDGVTSAIQTQIDGKQPLDADLTALAGLASAGIVARTGAGTVAARTLTAGAGISISNGDGVSGNPTISASAIGWTYISSQSVTSDATGLVTGLSGYRDLMIMGVGLDQVLSGNIRVRVGNVSSGVLSTSIYQTAGSGALTYADLSDSTNNPRGFVVQILNWNTTDAMKPVLAQSGENGNDLCVGIGSAEVMERFQVTSTGGTDNISAGTLYWWGRN